MVESTSGEKINKKYIESGQWQVQIADRVYPASVSLKPMYDPTNETIKA